MGELNDPAIGRLIMMTQTQKQSGLSLMRSIPSELVTLAAFALAIFGVVATGAAISSAITEPSPWLFAAAYGGPAALAFGVYWALARRV
jgi:hypothetical protein